MLGITTTDEDTLLSGYLDLAKDLILGHLYTVATPESTQTAVPSKYDAVQVMAVIAGYNLIGAEGEVIHNENGVHRHFDYSDMLKYIEGHVIPYARV